MPALDYVGAAKKTELASSITGADPSFTIVDATGWPDGSTGKWVVVIDPGATTEEKILCASRSGTTVTVDTRGYDGTAAVSHASGGSKTVYPTWDATSAQRHEDHIFDTTDAHAASAITFTPAGGVAAGNVQAAIAELDSEKLAAADAKTVATFYTEHTWGIAYPAVASGATDFIIPMQVYVAAGEAKYLTAVSYRIYSGTSVTFSLCGSSGFTDTTAWTGFGGLIATTAHTRTDPADVALSDTNYIRPNITAVSGTPLNLMITAVIKHVVTLT